MVKPSEFPPIKFEALLCLARGELRYEPDVGWRSQHSARAFNSHTVRWLAGQGWAVFSADHTVASISDAGRELASGAMCTV